MLHSSITTRAQKIIGIVYHPPNADNSEMLNYLIESMSVIEAKFFVCGIIILGDFNCLNVNRLITNFKLKEIINFATREPNTIDLVLTNLGKFYENSTKLAAFGLSDHVVVKPKAKTKSKLVHDQGANQEICERVNVIQ